MLLIVLLLLAIEKEDREAPLEGSVAYGAEEKEGEVL